MSAVATGSGAGILEAAELKFGQVGIANLRVRNADPESLRASLELRVREAPALFARAPVVVDLSFLSTPADAEVRALLEAVRGAGMLPVGLAYGDAATDALAQRFGLPLISRFRAAFERVAPHAEPESAPVIDNASTLAANDAVAPAALPSATLQHLKPVRSGQQVYAQGADLVVVGTVANGAEVLADGSIHVYGCLRGRAFAGAQGDASARIFCSEFRAEIIAIAGHYRVYEELPQAFAGRAVQIWLEQESGNPGKLQIAPL